MKAFVQFAYGKRHEQLVVHEFFLGIVTPAILVKDIASVRWSGATSSARTHWTNAHRSSRLHLYALHGVFHHWYSTSARGKHPAACSRTSIVFYVARHRDVSTCDNNICRLPIFFFLKDKPFRASLFNLFVSRTKCTKDVWHADFSVFGTEYRHACGKFAFKRVTYFACNWLVGGYSRVRSSWTDTLHLNSRKRGNISRKDTLVVRSIGLATKWLRILSIPPNDKIRNRLVANPIVGDFTFSNVAPRDICARRLRATNVFDEILESGSFLIIVV